MSFNKDYLNNKVPASNQVNKSLFCFEKPNAKMKILFLGNSITLHGPKKEIGWENNCGMAASSSENDYVHILINKIEQLIGDVSYYILSVSNWETNYADNNVLKDILSMINFEPDVIISKTGENIQNKLNLDLNVLEKSIEEYTREFAKKTKLFVCVEEFWGYTPVDEIYYRICQKYNGVFIHISDLGENDENKAIGKFEHYGVSIHPGDLGMRRIAERIFEGIKDNLKIICKR